MGRKEDGTDDRKDRKDREVSPAEFTRRMDEGESAGPGAPETETPTGGRPGPGGHGPKGPGGAAPERSDPAPNPRPEKPED